MTFRIIGACLILLGCGSFGFIISKNAKNEIVALKNFVTAMEYMECELQYRMTPLPSLCEATSKITSGIISKIFRLLSKELEAQVSPNVSICMTSVLNSCCDIPSSIVPILESLGERLGLFDLDGQIRVLASLRDEAEKTLKLCQDGHEIRSRSYKTVALCAGAAIVILLM